MIQKDRNVDPNPGRFVLLSFTLHVTALLICSYTVFFRPALHEAKPYYVDIVSLPAVESTPTPSEPEPAPPSPTTPAAPAPPPATLKTPPPAGKTAATAKTAAGIVPAKDSVGQEAKEVADKISRLERSTEEKHQAAALASLQKRVADRKGSDYGAYIQSRLKDTLATTMFYRSKAPEAAVRLYIDRNGKLVRYVMERPSSDKLFNDSVVRTIEKAKANFTPPPTNTGFEKLYIFSPQEVTN